MGRASSRKWAKRREQMRTDAKAHARLSRTIRKQHKLAPTQSRGNRG